jgi:hypothetical protein
MSAVRRLLLDVQILNKTLELSSLFLGASVTPSQRQRKIVIARSRVSQDQALSCSTGAQIAFPHTASLSAATKYEGALMVSGATGVFRATGLMRPYRVTPYGE